MRAGLAAYTNYVNRWGRLMATNWEKEHGSKEMHAEILKAVAQGVLVPHGDWYIDDLGEYAA